MNLLLDTQVVLWALADKRRLPRRIQDLLEHETNQSFISAVSIWEIAIKFALKKKSSPPFSGAVALALMEEANCRPLTITMKHVAALEGLPPIHRDPFDRLLVAQALSEEMKLVTSDSIVARYSDSFITW